MNELLLFAGAVGGGLATHHLLGWRAVGYVEMAEYPCKVIEARIKDGLLSPAPIFQMHTRDFIRLGLAEKYRGVAQVISAGFPCQPFSGAGLGLADKDPRNGWPDTIAIIRLVRPQYLILENVSRLVSSPYFGVILSDLAASGYSFRWDCIPAAAVGANHERDRLWIVAHSDSTEWGPCSQPGRDLARLHNGIHANGKETAGRTRIGSEAMADTDSLRWPGRAGQFRQTGRIEPENGGQVGNSERQGLALRQGQRGNPQPEQQAAIGTSGQGREWWAVEPELGRVDDELADRLDKPGTIKEGLF